MKFQLPLILALPILPVILFTGCNPSTQNKTKTVVEAPDQLDPREPKLLTETLETSSQSEIARLEEGIAFLLPEVKKQERKVERLKKSGAAQPEIDYQTEILNAALLRLETESNHLKDVKKRAYAAEQGAAANP